MKPVQSFMKVKKTAINVCSQTKMFIVFISIDIYSQYKTKSKPQSNISKNKHLDVRIIQIYLHDSKERKENHKVISLF